MGWDTTQDHAWFAAYAPAEDPEIVVVALVAHGGAGADAAAPIVMRVIGDYLGGRRAGSVGRTVSPARRSAGVPPPLPGGLRREIGGRGVGRFWRRAGLDGTRHRVC